MGQMRTATKEEVYVHFPLHFFSYYYFSVAVYTMVDYRSKL